MLSLAKRVREAVTPARRTSAFLTRGVLTPDEYVAAGDQLVFKCPTWSWEGGDPSKNKDCLPDPNKQFLVTRNVPCHRRAKALEEDYVGDTEVMIGQDETDGAVDGQSEATTEEAWVEPNVVSEPTGTDWAGMQQGDEDDEELQLGGQASATEGGVGTDGVSSASAGLGAIQLVESHFTAPPKASAALEAATTTAVGTGSDGLDGRVVDSSAGGEEGPESGGAGGVGGEEGYPDLDSFVEDNLMQGDEATIQAGSAYLTAQEPEDSILPTRSYDLSITYDKHHQTPRMWLFGYDELGQPLAPEEVFEDVMQDYARQTVTMELHPHLASHHASVHPCKHADTMKTMLANLTRGGKEARVDQYLFIFLKFIQSVVPTIDYDYTMTVDAGGGDANTADAFVEIDEEIPAECHSPET